LDVIANAYKGAESKQIVKESLELINELQKEYKVLEQDLKNTGDQRVATAMILNYKSRIEILEKLLEQLEYVTQLKNQRDEKISA
jgi:type II secretory pathway component PulJ